MISKLLIPLLIASQIPSLAEEEEEEKKNDILTRVPIGATATKVTIPSFDKSKKRASLLTAETVVVESENELTSEAMVLAAKDIVMRLFDKEEKMSATGTLVFGKYFLKNDLLEAEGIVYLKSTDNAFELTSDGGIFRLPTRQALFLGPGETFFTDLPKQKTAMNLRPILPLVAGLQLLAAMPPPEITAQELEKIDRLIATTTPPGISAEELSEFERLVAPRIIPSSEADQIEESSDAANAGLVRRLAEYLASVEKMDLLLQVKAPAPEPAAVEKRVLEDGQTSIKFDGGAYFDGENFEMVYLGNISLKQKNMSITCNKDLKVIFDPPAPEEDEAEKKQEAEEEKDEQPGFNGIGEMKQLTASGNLTLVGTDDKGAAVRVKGDRAFYDAVAQRILIRGDYLEFRRQLNGQLINIKADHKNAFVEFKFDGKNLKNAQTSKTGRWEAFHDTGKRNP